MRISPALEPPCDRMVGSLHGDPAGASASRSELPGMTRRHLLCIGAHPDDNEINVGGLAALWRSLGHDVRFVSVTNGDRGHHELRYRDNPSSLAHRRHAEALAAAAVIGAEYRTLGVRDGEVQVEHAATEAMVRCIRSFGEPGVGPDLVVFNRTIDYHRDHRNAAQLVVDATYLLTVPTFCPDTPHLARMPVFATWYDDFHDQGAFRTDVLLGIDAQFEAKVDMVCSHVSQFFEWLPYNSGTLDTVPPDPAGRRDRVAAILDRRSRIRTAAGADARVRISPGERSEAYQLCEYGRVPDDTEAEALFAGYGSSGG